ncbi:MAG: hypothetical protein MJ140_02545 [Ligilactobacillus sp.]|nr:hypothetical protein [Ligilactobacillus sp.]
MNKLVKILIIAAIISWIGGSLSLAFTFWVLMTKLATAFLIIFVLLDLIFFTGIFASITVLVIFLKKKHQTQTDEHKEQN